MNSIWIWVTNYCIVDFLVCRICPDDKQYINIASYFSIFRGFVASIIRLKFPFTVKFRHHQTTVKAQSMNLAPHHPYDQSIAQLAHRTLLWSICLGSLSKMRQKRPKISWTSPMMLRNGTVKCGSNEEMSFSENSKELRLFRDLPG